MSGEGRAAVRPPTAFLLAWRGLATRPRRTLVLLGGYALGVAVMIALLAVGDALLRQAADRDLVAGGDVVLLPEGIDPEVLKVGAVTGMFLAIPNARAVARQLLLGPRYAGTIAAVSPELTDELVYIRAATGTHAARADGALPSAARDARSALAVGADGWTDTAADRAWLAPDSARLLEEIDRFHAPPKGPQGRTWAEWWYFNFAGPGGLYGYISFVVDRDRRVAVGVTLRLRDGSIVRWEEVHPAAALPVDGSSLVAGPHRVDLRGGVYRIRLARPGFAAALSLTPVPSLYFPPVEWRSGEFRSGYVVPGLRASVEGTIRLGAQTFTIRGTGYHDHNWGVWQDVTWEWGTASTERLALLTGLIRHPSLRGQEMFVALYAGGADRPGLLSVLRATQPRLGAWRQGRMLDGRPVRVPGQLTYTAANDAGDRLEVEIVVSDVLATPITVSALVPGGRPARVFLQLRGRYRVRGVVAGRPISIDTPGFAETFVPLPGPPSR